MSKAEKSESAKRKRVGSEGVPPKRLRSPEESDDVHDVQEKPSVGSSVSPKPTGFGGPKVSAPGSGASGAFSGGSSGSGSGSGDPCLKRTAFYQKDWDFHLKSSSEYYFDSYNHYGVFEDLLKDEASKSVLRRVVLENAHLFKDKIVLNVGSGLGNISMLCARAGAKKVIGVEAASEVMEIARKVIKSNTINGKVDTRPCSEVIELVSGRFSDAGMDGAGGVEGTSETWTKPSQHGEKEKQKEKEKEKEKARDPMELKRKLRIATFKPNPIQSEE